MTSIHLMPVYHHCHVILLSEREGRDKKWLWEEEPGTYRSSVNRIIDVCVHMHMHVRVHVHVWVCGCGWLRPIFLFIHFLATVKVHLSTTQSANIVVSSKKPRQCPAYNSCLLSSEELLINATHILQQHQYMEDRLQHKWIVLIFKLEVVSNSKGTYTRQYKCSAQ